MGGLYRGWFRVRDLGIWGLEILGCLFGLGFRVKGLGISAQGLEV